MDLGESSEDEEEIEESLKVEVRVNKPVKETNQVRDNESKNELEREWMERERRERGERWGEGRGERERGSEGRRGDDEGNL